MWRRVRCWRVRVPMLVLVLLLCAGASAAGGAAGAATAGAGVAGLVSSFFEQAPNAKSMMGNRIRDLMLIFTVISFGLK